MKPIREWLKELPQDIYDRIKVYEGTEAQRQSWDFEVKNKNAAIMMALFWDETEEGAMFWKYVSGGKYDDARMFFSAEGVAVSAGNITGFIELTYRYGIKKRSIPVNVIEGFESYGKGCLVTVSGNHIEFEESYETVAELIRNATK